MKICAIVLDYYGAERTKACLYSLIGQGIDTVLVVDNSANAQASSALDQALNALRQSHADYKIELLRPSENLGFAKGVNHALANYSSSSCEFFLLINNDAIASQDMVAQLSKSLKNKDLVAPTILNEDGVPQPLMWYQRFIGLQTAHKLPFSFSFLSGCCLLFRRELLQDHKLFDEDFFMYGEDTFLGWRLDQTKKSVLIDAQATVRHVGHGSSREFGLFYEYHIARAHVLLALKTWRTPLEIPFLLFGKFIGLGMRGLIRSTRARSLIPLMAFFLAWSPLKIRVP